MPKNIYIYEKLTYQKLNYLINKPSTTYYMLDFSDFILAWNLFENVFWPLTLKALTIVI